MTSVSYAAMPAPGQAPLHVEVHDGLHAAIDEVTARAAPARAFLTRSWFEAAVDNPEKSRTLVMRRAGGEAVVALPVAPGAYGIGAVPGSYWPFRSFPVAEDLSAGEFGCFLAAPEVRKALGRVWRLGPVYSDDPVLALIEQSAATARWRLLKRRLATSFQVDFTTVDAAGPWPRKSTLRRNRQLENQMARLGPLEWLSLSGAQLDGRLFDELAALEAKGWHGSSRDAKFIAPHHRRVWDRLIADPAQAERLRIQLLTIDGTPAVMLFQLEAGPIVYGIATSYDPAFATHSPGKCLHMRALVAARARGVDRFDWGAGDSGYKQRLGACAGPDIVDCLVMRGPVATIAQPALRRIWRSRASHDAPVAETDGAAVDGVE